MVDQLITKINDGLAFEIRISLCNKGAKIQNKDVALLLRGALIKDVKSRSGFWNRTHKCYGRDFHSVILGILGKIQVLFL